MRTLHAAWLRVHQPGHLVPPDLWRRSVQNVIGGGASRQAAHNYTQQMADMGMVRSHPHEAVEILAPEHVLLPF